MKKSKLRMIEAEQDKRDEMLKKFKLFHLIEHGRENKIFGNDWKREKEGGKSQ